jgi:mono/diheme cytochrome c family protein
MRTPLLATIVISSLLSGAATGALAAEPASDGKALFTEKCGMCHRVMGMGTNLLDRRYAKSEPAMLEDRTNLSAAFVMTAARVGIGNMPRISRGEVSDPQLRAVAAYLAKGNP